MSRVIILCAEVDEHDGEIRNVQRAYEPTYPLFKSAAGERRYHGGAGYDEAGGDIEHHALRLDRHGLALKQGAKRHDERQVHDVRADDIADRQRGLLFPDGGYRRDELGQRGADSDHGRRDDGVGNADELRKLGAVINEKLCADDYRSRAENELTDVRDDRSAAHLGALGRIALASLLALCGDDALGHEADENEHDYDTLDDGKGAVARERKQQRDSAHEQARLDRELPSGHGAGHTHERQAHYKSSVRRDRAHRIANRDVGIALERGKDGDEHLRHGRSEAHDGSADDELGNARGFRYPCRGVNKKVAALDNAYKTDNE